jgi:hypothetical protein
LSWRTKFKKRKEKMAGLYFCLFSSWTTYIRNQSRTLSAIFF